MKPLSKWYSNEELMTNTRARRRIARRLMKEQPLFAFEIMREALPDYDFETFTRDSRPTGHKKRGRIPYSAKKVWIKQQMAKLDELDHRQINTLIDQMYNGPHWRNPHKDQRRVLHIHHTRAFLSLHLL